VSAGGRSVRVITLPSGSVTERGLSIFFKYILFTPFQVFPKTLCPQGLNDGIGGPLFVVLIFLYFDQIFHDRT
jgi:hypothetical protein